MSFRVGDTVGSYEIVSLLGTGGVGRVFKVKHRVTGRIEAMKVLLQNSGAMDQTKRFEREIKLQAGLQHPNIASVHNAFWAENTLVLIMELVPGDSLGNLHAKGLVPLRAGLDYICQALEALEFAHEHGVTHRDISPSNILVTPRGVVKVTDFGLALDETDSRLTDQGVAVGSAYYMSPEQIEAKESLDHRTDIYSIGAVLYELASDRKLFEGASRFDLMEAHVKKAPTPLLELNSSLPEALNDAIVCALSKKPKDRFASARAFRKELELVRKQCLVPQVLQADSFADTAELSLLPRPRKQDPLLGWIDRALRSTAVQVVAGVAALFLIIYMAALAMRPVEPREEIVVEKVDRPVGDAEADAGFTEAADTDDNRVVLMGPPEPQPTAVALDRPPPRRRSIVRQRLSAEQDPQALRGNRRKLPLSGVRIDAGNRLEPEQVATVRATPPTAPPTSFEGRSTRRLSIQPEGESPLANPFRADGLHAEAYTLTAGNAVQALAISRDGRFAAAAMEDNSIQLWDAATAKKRMTLRGHADRITSIAFSPDGKRLVTSSWDGTAKIWNLRTGREAATFGHRNYVTAATFSPDGEWLATGSSDRSVKLWSLNPRGKSHRYRAHLRTPQAMAFSPTSSLLASVSTSGDVRLWGVDEERAQGALNGPEIGSNAVVFSPDGKTLAIAGNNQLKLFDYPSRRPRNVIEIPGWLHAMTFTDDGRFLVLLSLA